MIRTENDLKLYYTELTEKDAPALFKILKEHAQKAELKNLPTVHIQSPEVPKESLDWVVGAGHVSGKPKGFLIIGNKGMNAFGVSDIKGPISEELSAVLAHEFSHIQHHDARMVRAGGFFPLAGLTIALTSLALIEHHFKSAKENTPKNPEDKLPGEKGYSYKQEAEERKQPLGGIWVSAKYLAAAALGFGTGIFARKMLHHHIEFRADKFSAQLMGDGKPLARALKMFDDAFQVEKARLREVLREKGTSENVISFNEKMRDFQNSITHPPIPKRIERLGGI